MRIVGGHARGCTLAGPGNKKIRPTPDKVRQALFNMIEVEGDSFCDLFSGTGAIGCEALSRGAASVTIVEHHLPSVVLIRQNVEKVSKMLPAPAQTRVVKQDAVEFLRGCGQDNNRFDFIYCDPPYDWDGRSALLTAAYNAKALLPDGILILEMPSKGLQPPEFEPIKEKRYGDTKLLFYSFG
ncbi:MAG: 16S rRNA (guanine(966)-N(2))-methyltransferase RsmD [Nitrospinae bacterium]|nr:16S rRNA (guanine(966)-N(2))-methyltransferase RsmD [Nitrospinota bacterium]